MTAVDWRPTASLATLQELYATDRATYVALFLHRQTGKLHPRTQDLIAAETANAIAGKPAQSLRAGRGDRARGRRGRTRTGAPIGTVVRSRTARVSCWRWRRR